MRFLSPFIERPRGLLARTAGARLVAAGYFAGCAPPSLVGDGAGAAAVAACPPFGEGALPVIALLTTFKRTFSCTSSVTV